MRLLVSLVTYSRLVSVSILPTSSTSFWRPSGEVGDIERVGFSLESESEAEFLRLLDGLFDELSRVNWATFVRC